MTRVSDVFRIEIDDVDAGIVVRERTGFRFHAAEIDGAELGVTWRAVKGLELSRRPADVYLPAALSILIL